MPMTLVSGRDGRNWSTAMNTEIDIFVRREGQPDPSRYKVEDAITIAALKVLIDGQGELVGFFLFEEESDEPLHDHYHLRHDGKDARYLHHSRCVKIEVIVRYAGKPHVEHEFGPGSTIGRVKAWAERTLEIDAIDGAELSLQIAGTKDRPDESSHVGSLVHFPNCKVVFDLLPSDRVNGAI
jgi:hypothetical protein